MDNIKKTELNHLQTDLADEMSHGRQYKALLALAMVVTLISYLFFSGHLKLGNPLYWGEYFNKGNVTIAAFVFMFISVILLGVFLAWVKHFAYSHFTTYRMVVGVMVTAIGFALLAEMFAALEDQKAKADIQLEGNAAYKATIQPTISSIGTSPALAGNIADASQRIARCEENLKRGKEKHCEGDKAALAALEKQQGAALNAQVAANKETEKLRYARQDQMKADAHNDFIVGIAKFYAGIFGTGSENEYVAYISWANITLMLIIAVSFERFHAFLIEAGRNIKGNIRGLEQRIAQLQESANPLSGGKHFPPAGQPLFKHQQEPKDGSFQKTGAGFTAPIGGKPATASYSPALPEAKKQPFGFIPARPAGKTREQIEQEESVVMSHKPLEPFKSKAFPDPAQLRKADGFRQSPEQLQRVYDLANDATGKTYRQELRSGSNQFRDVPLDKPEPARPVDQAHGKTGLHNPVLGTAEEQHEIAIPERVHTLTHAHDGATPSERVHTLTHAQESDLYRAWVSAVHADEYVLSGKGKTERVRTKRGSRTWIQKRICPDQSGVDSNHLKHVATLADAFFIKAERGRVFRKRSDFKSGMRDLYQYIG